MSDARNNRERTVTVIMEKAFPISRARAWEMLSDIGRVNRAIGFAPVRERFATAGEAGLAHLAAPFRFPEPAGPDHSFEWSRYRWHESYREYAKGPLRAIRFGVRLDDKAVGGRPGTLVQLYAGLVPAHSALTLPVRLAAKRLMTRTFRYVAGGLAADAEAWAIGAYPAAADKTAERQAVNEAKLAEGLRQLVAAGHAETLAAQAGRLIRQGDDAAAADIRPYALARAWDAPREDVLRLMLAGTRLGLFDLAWRVVCPVCKSSSETSAPLMPGHADRDRCAACGTAAIDRCAELRFSVHPAIRSVDRPVHCAGAPALSPHIHAQRLVPAGQTVELELPSHAIDWRLRVARGNERLKLALLAGPSAGRSGIGTAVLTEDGWTASAVTGYAGRRIAVTNERGADAVVAVEREGLDDEAAAASHALLLPEYRALFADSEAMAYIEADDRLEADRIE
ncbi:hypothetical protein SAMN02799624_03169 [Paenibacillus sp. UNC496MF]|uniref:DUF5939 domain-containing protein n=1 Tax=Paenibacillus sp. UNC496MF TaxID=1502753 RepID=UPI0008E50DC4|nr:DUF5939 domain-containing protein [Paenibacillus sp. UNC496MF]SFJ04794.1 hypothetical protein SAMN02799624_03169 [Paenibacillus sp. UNC496MF]